MLEENRFTELKRMLVIDNPADIYRDGFPYEYFNELSDSQKKDMVSFLLNESKNGDWRIVAGLGLLKVSSSEEILLKKLQNALNNKDGMLAVHSALSLWKIKSYEKSFDTICDVLYNFEDGNFEAIKALSEFKDRKSISVLLELLNDDDNLIRSRAMHSILKITNNSTIDSEGKPHKWILNMISKDMNEVENCRNDVVKYLKKYSLI